ncbi:MAG: ATP-grasp domain-containing protein [Moorellaceae bacterium]
MPKRRSATAVVGRSGGGGGTVSGRSGGVAGAVMEPFGGSAAGEIVAAVGAGSGNAVGLDGNTEGGEGPEPEILEMARALEEASEAVFGSTGSSAANESLGEGTGEGEGQTSAPVESVPPRDREVVFRAGYRDRLSWRLQRDRGELQRFNDLRSRYSHGDELTPEERGELYEYLLRRMNTPSRNLEQALQSGNPDRIRDAASQYVDRFEQLEGFVRRELPVSGREALMSFQEQAARARRMVEEDNMAAILSSIPEGTLAATALSQARSLMQARADLMGVSASADDYRAVVPKYAELERRLGVAREMVAEMERRGERVPPDLEREMRLAERWSQSARETSDVLRVRAGRLNFAGGERRNGFTVSRRAVTLPEPPPREALRSPEMQEAASRIFFSLPTRGRTSDLTRHLREIGIPYAASPDAPTGTVVHINWGSGGVFGEGVANRDTSGTVDKAEMLRRLGDLAPRSTFDVREAERLFGNRVVAKQRSGARGEGKEVIDLGTEEGRRKAYMYDFFQEFIPERDEYRVTLFGDEVLTAYRKNAVPGSGPEELSPERAYERVQRLPREAVEAAKEARRRCGVDLAGVDLIRDWRDGRWYVLEVNAAPGMGRDTLARLVQVVASRFNNQDQLRERVS